ncbi:hypothetical protein PG999_000512 [Apiospora kogelbergensis]|uniref:Uncharacterized protein n=1 Tax=Apiospora kogelbergensis TaxID=1337665 RepID=A0AAW0RC38_9PEZI
MKGKTGEERVVQGNEFENKEVEEKNHIEFIRSIPLSTKSDEIVKRSSSQHYDINIKQQQQQAHHF